MLFIGNVLTGLTVGTGGRVGRVMSGRILDGGSRKRPFTDVRARYWIDAKGMPRLYDSTHRITLEPNTEVLDSLL